MKTVNCRTCGKQVRVPDKARPSEYYCNDDCMPRCDYPGCTTLAGGFGGRCWVHRGA
jgi:hypothetical protein